MTNKYLVDFDRLIEGVEVYPRGLVVVKRRAISSNVPKGGERGQIVELTAKARHKMLAVLLRTNVKFNSLLTLTYPETYPRDGAVAKEHLKLFLRYMGDAFKSEDAWRSYFWFIEFQNRGAPHYHILVGRGKGWETPTKMDRAKMALCWIKAIGLGGSHPYKDANCDHLERERQKVFNVHSHRSAWEKIRKEDGAIRYATKYALKMKQKEVPQEYQNVGRFWGCSKDVRSNISTPVEYEIRGDELRGLLEGEGHRASDFDAIPKYLFGSRSLDLLIKIGGGEVDENPPY